MINPLAWYIAGPLLAMIMVGMLLLGRHFGISSSLDTICAMTGVGKKISYFNFDWRSKSWSLLFVLGTILGGFLSALFWDTGVGAINPATIEHLAAIGISAPVDGYLPPELYELSKTTVPKILLLLGGGFLVGFGARYAGGCTSGHAISGLSNLQVGSLVAVIGFFIGGLIMTHLVLPILI